MAYMYQSIIFLKIKNFAKKEAQNEINKFFSSSQLAPKSCCFFNTVNTAFQATVNQTWSLVNSCLESTSDHYTAVIVLRGR